MSLTGKETVNLVGLDNNGFPAGVSQDVPLNSIVAVHSTLAHLTVKTIPRQLRLPPQTLLARMQQHRADVWNTRSRRNTDTSHRRRRS